LANFRATGRYDAKSPNCYIYKALFPEIMRLEGLRLLKEQPLQKSDKFASDYLKQKVLI
jgi:type II secretory pathway component PulL